MTFHDDVVETSFWGGGWWVVRGEPLREKRWLRRAEGKGRGWERDGWLGCLGVRTPFPETGGSGRWCLGRDSGCCTDAPRAWGKCALEWDLGVGVCNGDPSTSRKGGDWKRGILGGSRVTWGPSPQGRGVWGWGSDQEVVSRGNLERC